MVRPHQGSLSGEAWFRAHVCVAADKAGKKENRTRGGAGWQILDLLRQDTLLRGIPAFGPVCKSS